MLDLDETLVYSSLNPNTPSDFTIEININNQHLIYNVSVRPQLGEFLIKMEKWYHLVVYTASVRQYADMIIDKIDPNGLIKKRLYREECVVTTLGHVKDLSLLTNDLASVILVDNSQICFELFPNNCVLCTSYGGDKSDFFLEGLGYLLDGLRFTGDVRSFLGLRLEI